MDAAAAAGQDLAAALAAMVHTMGEGMHAGGGVPHQAAGSGLPGGTSDEEWKGTGKTKVWFEEKGFGFITPDDGRDDIFVHRRALSDGQALEQGTSVTYFAKWDALKGKATATQVSGAVSKGDGGKGVGVMTGTGNMLGKGEGLGGPGMPTTSFTMPSHASGESSAAPAVPPGSIQHGTVRTFNDERGFGFVIPEGGTENIFCHANALVDGQTLVEGAFVTFRVDATSANGKPCVSMLAGASPKGSGKGTTPATGPGAMTGVGIGTGVSAGAPGTSDGMQPGIVQMWNAERGFGFIAPAGGGADIYVHATALVDGTSLERGASVMFETSFHQGRGKVTATKVYSAGMGALPLNDGGAGGGPSGYGKAAPVPEDYRSSPYGQQQQVQPAATALQQEPVPQQANATAHTAPQVVSGNAAA